MFGKGIRPSGLFAEPAIMVHPPSTDCVIFLGLTLQTFYFAADALWKTFDFRLESALLTTITLSPCLIVSRVCLRNHRRRSSATLTWVP